MWQSPNQRVDAIHNTKKRQNERVKRPLHLGRLRVAIRLVPPQETHAQAKTHDTEGETIEARVVLNDLSETGIGIYTSISLQPGQDIQITLEEPEKTRIWGKVVWCQQQLTGSPVLSAKPFHFRAGVKFSFASPEEEAAFKKLCEQLKSQHLYRPNSP